MAGFTDLRIHREMDENKIRLSISLEKSAEVASPYAISSSVPEAAKNDNEEFKKTDLSQEEVLEISRNSISCRNQSSKNTSIEQELSRYQKCNRVTTLRGDKNDAGCSRSNYRCGMHEDLLFDIMLWLPVVSLLRFRSVCRLWCSLIDSSTFITQHYNHNSNKNGLLALHVVSSYVDDYDSKFCLLSGNKYEVYSNLDYEQPWYSVNEITILNSYDGLVSLLSKESGNVALWNPATKQLRPLPESHCNGMTSIIGFGFDAKSNDYKFVKIFYHQRNKYNNLVEVYSLRTDSWKVIHKDDVLPFEYIDCDSAACNKESCFWTGYTHDDEVSPILISLDLNNEVFETMPLPVESQYDCTYKCLDLLNGKLCYIKNVSLKPFVSDDTYFEIWMLDEYGVKQSWKNICKLGPIGSPEWQLIPEVVRFSNNRESLILGCCGYGELYLFSFDAREEEYLDLQNSNPLPSKLVCYNKLQNPNLVLSEFVWYNESLVSLRREDDGAYK